MNQARTTFLRLLVFSAAAATSPVLAQTVEEYESTDSYQVQLQPASSASAYSRTCVASVDGDRMPDFFYLVDDTIAAMMGPGLYEAPMTPFAQAFDLKTIPNGDLEAVLIVNDTGLQRVTRDGTLTGPGWVIETVRSDWSNVKDLSVIEAGGTFVVGLENGGTRVRWHRLGTSIAGFADVPIPIVDLAAVQYDGVGAVEIAMASSSTLHIMRPVGSALVSVDSFTVGGIVSTHVECLQRDDSALDRVAWIARSLSDQTSTLAVVGSGVFLDAEWLGTASSPVGVTAADFDNDGRDDLIMSRAEDFDVGVLTDEGATTPDFTTANPAPGTITTVIPPFHFLTVDATPAGPSHATPALGDVDGDGDLDVLMPVFLDGGMLYVHKDPRVKDQLKMIPERVYLNSDNLVAALLDNQQNLTLKFAWPEVIPQAATHMDIQLWCGSLVDANGESTLDSQAEAFQRFDLSTAGDEFEVTFTIPGGVSSYDDDCQGFENIAWITRRLVQAPDLWSAATHRYPAGLYGIQALTKDTDNANADYLANLHGEIDPFVVAGIGTACPGPDPQNDPGTSLGGDGGDGRGDDEPCLAAPPDAPPKN